MWQFRPPAPLRLLPTLRMNVCRRVETRYNIVRWQRSTQQPRLPGPSFCSTPNACCARPTFVSFWSGIIPRFPDWHLCRATSGSSYRKHGMDPNEPTSMLVVEGNRMRRDSDAVISIYERLGFPWSLVWIFRSVPPSLRDPIYRLVAIKRYRLFGRRNSCWIAPGQYRPHPLTGTAHQADADVGQKRRRMRVMILGGYDVFGGRLIELPSDIDELVLVVCGRSLEPAREFCALYGGAARVEPLALDGSNVSKAPRANKRRLGRRRQDH
ncbi:thiol-disulfide oxidoreductase DCC family protein [Pseudorhizobium pelagicum]|uniref:thiol-disulfide oxidoreductase DCC family protein n=1 Tax=Pseudorhizobium pelagicum TaxID=1509405 RepID=UPI0026B38AA5